MAAFRTHYDNLKVSRNAPPEVIRAAYKALSQRYHPDRNPGNAEAARIMAIINSSYEVLSDPAKRREHDQWIMEMEAASQVNNETGHSVQATIQRSSSPPVLLRFFLPLFNVVKSLVMRAIRILAILIVISAIFRIIGVAIDFFGGKSPPPPGPKPYQSNPARIGEVLNNSLPPRGEGWGRGSVSEKNQSVTLSPSPLPEGEGEINQRFLRPEYVRPIRAPNGQPWPISAGYVRGYPLLHADGLSTVTVDNSRNDSDVFVKLVSLDGAQAYPVRQFYIPAFGSFTLNKVTAGSYDIRYRDLSSGSLSRSEAFNLEEIQTYDGVQYSNITITLYKVHNGNMQTYGLSEEEF